MKVLTSCMEWISELMKRSSLRGLTKLKTRIERTRLMKYLKKLIKQSMYSCCYLLNLPVIFLNRVRIGKGCHFRGLIYVKHAGEAGGNICIGNKVNINSSLHADPIGGQTKTILYVRKKGHIEIQDRVGISNTAIVAENLVEIGEDSNIGGGTKIYDTDFHSLYSQDRLNGDTNVKSAPVVIGRRVFIGGHCIILKGVHIGDDAVIGAGSVVTRDIPSGEIWAGNPAVCIKKNHYRGQE